MFEPTYMKDLNQQYTGVCVGLNTIKQRTDQVIGFLRGFKRYQDVSYEDLYQMISPSVRLEQYRIWQDQGKIWGFTNWAFVNQEVLDRFLEHGRMNTLDWQSGFKQMYVEFVCEHGADEMMSWMKNYSLNLLGPNVRCYWIRSEADQIRVRKIRTKENWRWAE